MTKKTNKDPIYISIDYGTENIKIASNAKFEIPEIQQKDPKQKEMILDMNGVPEGVHVGTIPARVTRLDNLNILKAAAKKRDLTVEEMGQYFYGHDAINIAKRISCLNRTSTEKTGESEYPLTNAEIKNEDFFNKSIAEILSWFDKTDAPKRVLLQVAPTLLYQSQTQDTEDLKYNLIDRVTSAFDGAAVALRLLPQTSGTAVYAGLGAEGYACVGDLGGGTDDFHIVRGQDPSIIGKGELALLKDGEENICGRYMDDKLYNALTRLNGVVHNFETCKTKKELLISKGDAKHINREYGFVGEEGVTEELKKYELSLHGTAKGCKHDISELVKATQESILKPMVKTIGDLISAAVSAIAEGDPDVITNDVKAQIRENIYLSGQRAKIRGLAPTLQKKLASEYDSIWKVHVIDNPVLGPALGGLEYIRSLDESSWNEK